MRVTKGLMANFPAAATVSQSSFVAMRLCYIRLLIIHRWFQKDKPVLSFIFNVF